MSIGTFFAISCFFITVLMFFIILIAICYNCFEHKRNFIISETILIIIMATLVMFLVRVNIKFAHPEEIHFTIMTSTIVPNSETYKPATVFNNAHVTFVTSDNYENIEFIPDYIDIKIIADSQPETYEKTIYSFLFIKKQADKLYITADTYNRLFN